MNVPESPENQNKVRILNFEEKSEVNVLKEMKAMMDAMQSVLINQLNGFKDEIKQEIGMVKKEVGELKASVEFAHAEIKELKSKMQVVEKESREDKLRICTLELKLNSAEEKMEKMERYSREYNLRFAGIHESEGENCASLIQDLCKRKLRISENVHVENAHRIGRRGDKPRSIIAKMLYRPERHQILLAAKMLKGTNIVISEDLTTKEVKLKNENWKAFIEAKKNQKKAFFRRAELFVDGVRV